MELNEKTIKQIKEIILFTAVVFVCFWKYETVLSIAGFVIHIIFPFILGGAIAFVLNVPMNFLKDIFFRRKKLKRVTVRRNWQDR